MTRPAWLTLKVAGYILLGIVAVALLAGAYRLLTGSPKAEARLGKNTTEAALQSGRDAVDTVGEQGAAEDRVDAITKENEDAIRNAEGADAPVADPARAAGLRSLCKRAAYRGRPECLQHAPAR